MVDMKVQGILDIDTLDTPFIAGSVIPNKFDNGIKENGAAPPLLTNTISSIFNGPDLSKIQSRIASGLFRQASKMAKNDSLLNISDIVPESKAMNQQEAAITLQRLKSIKKQASFMEQLGKNPSLFQAHQNSLLPLYQPSAEKNDKSNEYIIGRESSFKPRSGVNV